MKYIITVLIIMNFTYTQAQSLKVSYVEKMNLTEKLKSITNPMIKQMIINKLGKPKYYELLSTKGLSIYKEKSDDNDDNSSVTAYGLGNGDSIYKNLKNNTYTKQTNFMSRSFLIKDTLLKKNWKITDQTTKIGDYICKKAILKKDDKDDKCIIAWFSEDIPSNEGPREYYGLPGLILKVETDAMTIIATDILMTKENANIEKPSKGKVVTQKEFDKIKKDKIKNLTGGKKSNGGVQIIKM